MPPRPAGAFRRAAMVFSWFGILCSNCTSVARSGVPASSASKWPVACSRVAVRTALLVGKRRSSRAPMTSLSFSSFSKAVLKYSTCMSSGGLPFSKAVFSFAACWIVSSSYASGLSRQHSTGGCGSCAGARRCPDSSAARVSCASSSVGLRAGVHNCFSAARMSFQAGVLHW